MRRFDRAQTGTTAATEAAGDNEHRLTLRLEGYAWESISEEAAREGLTVEELVGYAVLYYLADVDSGRIARQVSRSPSAQPARAGR
jgi:hypothetical protein